MPSVRQPGKGTAQLKIVWRQTSPFGDARQHPSSDLFIVVERERVIGPIRAGEGTVRAGLAFHLPADLQRPASTRRAFADGPLLKRLGTSRSGTRRRPRGVRGAPR